ncbi:hydrogenase 4 subunit B [Candidatus Micrarchaeota archaeon]|nr:hydrogenase 4 subunit B [Candidatus Micrarchaeota archaeon]
MVPSVFSLFLAAVALFAGGMLASLLSVKSGTWSRRLGVGFALGGSAAALGAGVWALAGGFSGSFVLATLPQVGSLSLGMDALSGFFAALIGLLGVAVCLYSFSYVKAFEAKGYSASRFGFLFNLFLLSMVLVVTAQNALVFLVVWELMALSSYFLVVYEHEEKSAADAGFMYLLVTHVGTAALIVMFLILGSVGGSLDFSAFSSSGLPASLKDAVFVLALVGFGAKAGIMPLHVWLPQAHPAAPSNVSALMSGVMVKTALYGLVRVLFGFLGVATVGPAAWWAEVLLGLGMLSAVLGALYALAENDLKRLLAFSTIENVGILFMGLGASLLFFSAGHGALGALALLATLYHAVNHAVFKGLLFLGAGALMHAAHSKDLGKMGGLVKAMPYTAALFFVGVVAMAALPPLNGFAGEWLLFQSFLGGVADGSSLLSLSLAAATVFLALGGALALAVSVKAFGVPFLGMARSVEAANAREVPLLQIAAMGILAAACVVLGAFPGAVGQGIQAVLETVGVTDMSAAQPLLDRAPTPWLFVLLAAGFLAAVLIVGLKRIHAPAAKRPTWDCGIAQVTPRMQYSAAGVSMPTLREFSWPLDPLKKAEASGHRFFEAAVYRPILDVFWWVAPYSRRLQTGKLYHYLVYLMATLVGVLLYALV